MSSRQGRQASIPFGAFAPLLPGMDSFRGGRLGLLRRASEAVVERAGRDRPLLLVVDDAHLLDHGSAALVHQLVQASYCSLLANLRTPGPAPDPITTLWKDGLADRLDLDVLSETEVEELVTSSLGGPVTGSSVRWLWEVSAGNPLYVRELLVGAADSGALHDDGGMWVLRLPLPAPKRLAELVASRLADLAPETAHVVDLLAVGEPLGFSVLGAIVPMGAVEDAESRGLISVRDRDSRSETGLSHPLYGEVRRQAMPRIRLRRLCSALAEALQATGARRHDDVLRIARRQLDAGIRGDPVLLGRAGRLARQMFDLDLAARLAGAAVDSGGGVEAGLALAEAQFYSGRTGEAEAVLAGLYAACTNDEERSQVANARSYNLGTLMGDQVAAATVLDAAQATIVEPRARHRLVYRRASDRVYSGEMSSALADATQLLDSGDGAMVHRGAAVASVAQALLGCTDEAVTTAYRGLEVHRRCGDVTRQPEAQLVGAVLGQTAGGRLAEAEAYATAGYQAGLEAGDKDCLATFCLLRGWVLVERGLLAAASRMFREGATINRELRDVAPLRWCIGGTALAEGMAGNSAPARSAVAEVDELPRHWMTAFDGDLIERSRAWAKVAAGEVSAGRAILREAASRAFASHYRVAEARLLHDVARLGEPASVSGRLAELATVVDGSLVVTMAEHAAALSRAAAAELEAAATGFDELGAWQLAAEAARAAEAAYRGEGRVRQASACRRKATELEDRCGGVRTPGVAYGAHTELLTRREREVAGLAAQGVSSREIADRLYLSVRTVDNHLQRIYTKLGVTSREDVAAALRPV